MLLNILFSFCSNTSFPLLIFVIHLKVSTPKQLHSTFRALLYPEEEEEEEEGGAPCLHLDCYF
jgi:hypothetical protein